MRKVLILSAAALLLLVIVASGCNEAPGYGDDPEITPTPTPIIEDDSPDNLPMPEVPDEETAQLPF